MQALGIQWSYMKKIIVGLVGLLCIATPVFAQVVPNDTPSTQEALVTALQTVIGLLQQEVAVLTTEMAAKLQGISDNQVSIATELAAVSQQNNPVSELSATMVTPSLLLVDGRADATSTDTILGSDCQAVTHTFSLVKTDGSLSNTEVFSVVSPDGLVHDREVMNGDTSVVYTYNADQLSTVYNGGTVATGTAVFYVTSEGLRHEFDVTILPCN